MIFTNYPCSKAAAATNLVKRNLEESQGTIVSSRPLHRYLFYSCRFPNEPKRTQKNLLSSNSHCRRPEILPATETLFKTLSGSIIVSTLLEVDPGGKVVPQPNMGMEQHPTRQLLLTMSFTCDRVHPHAVGIRKS